MDIVQKYNSFNSVYRGGPILFNAGKYDDLDLDLDTK
jgi:hypothetical protein